MFYNVAIDGITFIDGFSGKYDDKIKDNSVRYARNAVDNFKQAYNEDKYKNFPDIKGISKLKSDEFNKKADEYDNFIEHEIPWSKFELKYSPKGAPDIKAAMGAAYEELGCKTSVSTEELTKTLQEGLSNENKNKFSAASLDINSDGKIDLAEYSASILVEDMLSPDIMTENGKNGNNLNAINLDVKNLDGKITHSGQNALLAFAAVNNYQGAKETYKQVYKHFNLEDAQKQFLKQPDNTYVV